MAIVKEETHARTYKRTPLIAQTQILTHKRTDVPAMVPQRMNVMTKADTLVEISNSNLNQLISEK